MPSTVDGPKPIDSVGSWEAATGHSAAPYQGQLILKRAQYSADGKVWRFMIILILDMYEL